MNNLGSKRRRSWRLLPVLGALDSVKVEKFGVCVGLSIGEVHTSLLLLLAIGVASAGATSDATSKATRANLSATAAPAQTVGGFKDTVRIGGVAVREARRVARRARRAPSS